MFRLFVALPCPDDTSDDLASLFVGTPGVRWVDPDMLHLTLRFIGEVDGGMARDIDDALSGIRSPSFEVQLSGLGVFGQDRKEHTLWVGVERNPALQHLRDRVESAVVRCGLEPAGRKFTPHVTVARLRGAPPHRLAQFMGDAGLVRPAPFLVTHFTLYSSLLGRAGPVYTPEAIYPLANLPDWNRDSVSATTS